MATGKTLNARLPTKTKSRNHKTLRGGDLEPRGSARSRTLRHHKIGVEVKTNHRWSCVSSELSWVDVSRLFLDHDTRVEVSRTTFLVSKCLETGAEVSQSV